MQTLCTVNFPTYHDGTREVPLVHLGGEPVDFPPRVAEDDGLGDGERLVQITQGVQLPLLYHVNSVSVSAIQSKVNRTETDRIVKTSFKF